VLVLGLQLSCIVPSVLCVGSVVIVTVFGGVLSMVMSVALSVLSSVPVVS